MNSMTSAHYILWVVGLAGILLAARGLASVYPAHKWLTMLKVGIALNFSAGVLMTILDFSRVALGAADPPVPPFIFYFGTFILTVPLLVASAEVGRRRRSR
ncbi:MAG: hypothetical protein IBX63_09870 [Coriobacteriia bacterium]|nr:hypothetical protein [Coriobacteriia bacterium]